MKHVYSARHPRAGQPINDADFQLHISVTNRRPPGKPGVKGFWPEVSVWRRTGEGEYQLLVGNHYGESFSSIELAAQYALDMAIKMVDESPFKPTVLITRAGHPSQLYVGETLRLVEC